MNSLGKLVAAHPLRVKTPYNAIKFARIDQNGALLYTVCRDKKELGAAAKPVKEHDGSCGR